MTVVRGPVVSCRWFVWLILGIFGAVFSVGRTVDAAKIRTEPLSEEIAEEYGLDPAFYKKVTRVEDILIATSEQVSDLAHRETAYQFRMVMK